MCGLTHPYIDAYVKATLAGGPQITRRMRPMLGECAAASTSLTILPRGRGWWGYSEGPGPDKFMVYNCGCGEHVAFIANEPDDLDYYEIQSRLIGECDTEDS